MRKPWPVSLGNLAGQDRPSLNPYRAVFRLKDGLFAVFNARQAAQGYPGDFDPATNLRHACDSLSTSIRYHSSIFKTQGSYYAKTQNLCPTTTCFILSTGDGRGDAPDRNSHPGTVCALRGCAG